MIISKFFFLYINKFVHYFKLIRIEETPTYLNMIQSLLFNKKKIISQGQEITRIPKSYPFAQLTHWDVILCK